MTNKPIFLQCLSKLVMNVGFFGFLSFLVFWYFGFFNHLSSDSELRFNETRCNTSSLVLYIQRRNEDHPRAR